jgi:hypothetical protein
MAITYPVTIVRKVQGNQYQTFTFAPEMIHAVSSNLQPGVSDVNLPKAGPMQGYGIDMDGVKKTITISGDLTSQPNTVVTGSGNPIITEIETMKYWLEGLADGDQQGFGFTSNYERYSLLSPNNNTTISGVSIPGNFVLTKVYVTGMSFNEAEASPDKLPFSITFTCLGAL